MALTVALVGNPNCGKTTLFNALTGSNQYVGNWPGVTVEKKTGKLKENKDVEIVDLPGIYSLSPYTLEEVVARNYLIQEHPDAILNIIDGTNLERNLYLTTQALELGIPLVVAVNMMDIVEKRGMQLDTGALAKILGCKVVEISALKGTGIQEVSSVAVDLAKNGHAPIRPHQFAADIEAALNRIEDQLPASVPASAKRYYAVKLFERDAKVLESMPDAPKVEDIIKQVEQAHDDDAESIITNERYTYVTSIIDDCRSAMDAQEDTTSDKIDRVVTNRFLALPIFVVVMFLVYFISVTTVGGWATDWANDGVFGDGWFVGGSTNEQGVTYEDAQGEYDDALSGIEAYATTVSEDTSASPQTGEAATAVLDALAAEEDASPEDLQTLLSGGEAAGVESTFEAYDDETGEDGVVYVAATEEEAQKAALSDSDIASGMAQAEESGEEFEVPAMGLEDAIEVYSQGAPEPSSFGLWVPGIPVLIGDGLTAINCDEQISALVLDGIVGGVGAVLGFVPQILVLFLLLAALESCGYMSRIAFILDRVFRRFGLSGKSFVPILIGTGCGVPGIMASRTIENQNDRRMTVMTTTFIPCSAKLPIIALFAGAVFGGVWWVAPSAYFLGIAAILCSGIILKKTRAFSGDPAPFVMELPAYHLPTVGAVLRSMWERAWSFIKKAGTIILLACILVYLISSYGFVDGAFGLVEDQNDSILALLGSAICWLFVPLGWGDWQAASAAVTGLIAKENVVGTFGILYSGGEGWYANVQAAFLPFAAYSFLAFNLLCAPCFAAMGAIRREMNSAKWFWAAIGYECGLAYCVALVIYQLGGLIGGEVAFNPFTIVAGVLAVLFFYLLFRPAPKSAKKSSTATLTPATAKEA